MTTADLPDHASWEKWFPADWVSEMREQVRLWFYSQLFMSVTLTGQAPFRTVLSYEKMLDEHGKEMHGSWGNMVTAEDAFERMGADVMRWQYCMQPPTQNLLFGFGRGREIQRKLLTLWNSARLLVQYANLSEFSPDQADIDELGAPRGELQVLDAWALARTAKLVEDATTAYDAYLTADVLRAFEAYVEDLSNWYIRLSRRRFWDGDVAALRTLWHSLVQALRVIAPVMPFLTDNLWRVLVSDLVDGAPVSIFLAGWPAARPVDQDLLASMDTVRQVVELGRQARAAAGLKVRQPLRQLVVEGADGVAPYLGMIANELRVKEVAVGSVNASNLRVRPNLPVLGPRLGQLLPRIRKALESGDFEMLDDGGVRVDGHDLAASEVLVDRSDKPGWVVMSNDQGITVALDTAVDDELRLEARVNDLVHTVNRMRRDAGLEIPDRINLVVPAGDADLLGHSDWIKAETLAVQLAVGDDDEIRLSKTSA
jgi:isoleucyl-tRNA synthetase